MTPSGRSLGDVVLAAWAPAGWGRIVVLLGQGVVIHKFVVSGKAAATGVAETLGLSAETPPGNRDAGIGEVASANELRASPFIAKVLRNGVEGLLASSRTTLLPWDRITSVEYRELAAHRGRLVIRTRDGEHKLKFLMNTIVAGDPVAAFTHNLADRFTIEGRSS